MHEWEINHRQKHKRGENVWLTVDREICVVESVVLLFFLSLRRIVPIPYLLSPQSWEVVDGPAQSWRLTIVVSPTIKMEEHWTQSLAFINSLNLPPNKWEYSFHVAKGHWCWITCHNRAQTQPHFQPLHPSLELATPSCPSILSTVGCWATPLAFTR